MSSDFCNYAVGEGFWLDGAGNIIKRKNFDGSFLPMEELRKVFLEATEVDIYDTVKVYYVYHSKYGDKVYYDIFVRKAPGAGALTGYLLDGETGEILFKTDTHLGPGGIWPLPYREYLKSRGLVP